MSHTETGNLTPLPGFSKEFLGIFFIFPDPVLIDFAHLFPSYKAKLNLKKRKEKKKKEKVGEGRRFSKAWRGTVQS